MPDNLKAELNSWVLDTEEERLEKLERETARYPKMRREMGLDLIDTSNKNILEIGGGPVGIIADIPAKHKVIIDPLADEYRKYFPCPYHIKGYGEKLNLVSGTMDMVVITNALDHCTEPYKVLKEATRVLRAGGWLAIHNCLNLATNHPHPSHLLNLDEDWFYSHLEKEFEIVHKLNWSKDKLRYGWVSYKGKVGQPAIALLARKVTGYA